ncbi:MAG: PLxRFG domain-containing protein, partial [Gammaproteobacteria bacterium SHHR-1]
LKSMRYADEGVLNMKGDPVVSENQLTPFDIAWQAVGFQPDKIGAQYAANNQAKTYERRILDRRSRLMGGFAMAVMEQDIEARKEALEKIRKFNQANPRMRIDYPALQRSIKTRLRYRQEADAGIHLNKNLRYLREETRVPM